MESLEVQKDLRQKIFGKLIELLSPHLELLQSWIRINFLPRKSTAQINKKQALGKTLEVRFGIVMNVTKLYFNFRKLYKLTNENVFQEIGNIFNLLVNIHIVFERLAKSSYST
jgi:hypothetical protein